LPERRRKLVVFRQCDSGGFAGKEHDWFLMMQKTSIKTGLSPWWKPSRMLQLHNHCAVPENSRKEQKMQLKTTP
jgi:hypothetical protein